MDEPKQEVLRRYCRHELGHWLAAKNYGFHEDYIRVKLTYDYQGRMFPDAYSKSHPKPDLPEKNDVYLFLRKRIVALMSGVAAEFMVSPDGDIDIKQVESALRTTASNDSQQIEQLIGIARGIRFAGQILPELEAAQVRNIHDACWVEAIEIVSGAFQAIQDISREMAGILMDTRSGRKFTRDDIEGMRMRYLSGNT